MKSSRFFALVVAEILLSQTAAHADGIDMNDPRRALGREDDVRVDARLLQESVVPGVPIGVIYQIQNFTETPVAVADKVSSASYDGETRTITITLGSEVPEQNLPHLVVIAPGEKKILHAAALPSLTAAASRASVGGAPRFVQLKVAILRDVTPFRALIDRQGPGPQPLADALFDTWLESNDTILLNSVPVQFSARAGNSFDVEGRDASHASY